MPLVAALLGAIVLAFAGIASAGTVIGTSGNNNPGGLTGNRTKVTHDVATYADPVFGQVNCTGVNQLEKGAPMQDSFTCTSTQGGLQNVTPGQVITGAPTCGSRTSTRCTTTRRSLRPSRLTA